MFHRQCIVTRPLPASCLRFRQQFPLSSYLQFPLAGAFEPRQRVELSRRFVEPAGVPQQRGQHQPGVQVADVSPQQPFQDVFRLIVIAFQVMVQGLDERVFVVDQGCRRLPGGDIA